MAIFDKDNNRLPPTTIQKPPPHEEEVISEKEEKEPLKRQDLGYFYDKILENTTHILQPQAYCFYSFILGFLSFHRMVFSVKLNKIARPGRK